MKTISQKIATSLIAVTALGVAAQAQDNAAMLGAEIMSMDGTQGDTGILAATGWHDCDVIRTGAGWGNHYVALTCPTGPFSDKWHILRADQMDAQLATALAAATADEKVQVYIGGPVSGYNEIRALYLKK